MGQGYSGREAVLAAVCAVCACAPAGDKHAPLRRKVILLFNDATDVKSNFALTRCWALLPIVGWWARGPAGTSEDMFVIRTFLCVLRGSDWSGLLGLQCCRLLRLKRGMLGQGIRSVHAPRPATVRLSCTPHC